MLLAVEVPLDFALLLIRYNLLLSLALALLLLPWLEQAGNLLLVLQLVERISHKKLHLVHEVGLWRCLKNLDHFLYPALSDISQISRNI